MNEESAEELIKHYERDVIPLKDRKIAKLEAEIGFKQNQLDNLQKQMMEERDKTCAGDLEKIAELQSALEAAREALTNIAEDNVHHPDNDGNCMLCNDEELSRCIQSAAKAALASLPAPQGKEEGKL